MPPDHDLPQVRRVSQHATLYAQVRQELLSDVAEERLGADYRYDLDLAQRRIELSSPRGSIALEAQLLASIAVRPASILWGFAPLFADHVGQNPLAAELRRAGEHHGLDELVRDEVAYAVEPGENPVDTVAEIAHWIGQMGVELFGADTLYYTYPTGGAGSRQVVLVRQGDLALPPVTLVDVFVRFPRLASSLDDVGWALDGLCRLRQGWRFEQVPAASAQQAFRVYDEHGAWFEAAVTRDEHQRITNISGNGVHQPGA